MYGVAQLVAGVVVVGLGLAGCTSASSIPAGRCASAWFVWSGRGGSMASRRNNFMPSQFAGKTKPEETAAPRAPVQRDARLPQPSGTGWVENQKTNALGRMRIAGRHREESLDREELAEFFKETGIPDHQALAAFEAGRRDRAAGVRCMCPLCMGMRASLAEDLRSRYWLSRMNELTDAGVAYIDAMRQTENEIAQGKATT